MMQSLRTRSFSAVVLSTSNHCPVCAHQVLSSSSLNSTTTRENETESELMVPFSWHKLLVRCLLCVVPDSPVRFLRLLLASTNSRAMVGSTLDCRFKAEQPDTGSHQTFNLTLEQAG